jgi:transposase InsO family protein
MDIYRLKIPVKKCASEPSFHCFHISTVVVVPQIEASTHSQRLQYHANHGEHQKQTEQDNHPAGASYLTHPPRSAQSLEPSVRGRRTRPDQKWVTDITYIPTEQGWLYLAAIPDLFSRRVVGWSMISTMHASLVKNALRMAIVDRQPEAGLLHHTDRGLQYAGSVYQSLN